MNDTTGIDLGASAVRGTLVVAATGAITQSGALAVTGATTLTAGAGNDITLAGANNFSTVSVVTGRNVQLNDTSGIDLGASTVSGTLAVTAAGTITDSGALTVTNGTTLTAGANAITLDNANNFSTVSVVSGTAVVLNDTNAIDLGAISSSSLNVTAGAGVTSSGALLITGNSTYTAADTTSIALTNAANNFGGTVTFASPGTLADVSVLDTTALDLGALSISGNLTVTAAGITQSGALVVPGTASLTAGAGNDITLAGGNNLRTASILTGRHIQL